AGQSARRRKSGQPGRGHTDGRGAGRDHAEAESDRAGEDARGREPVMEAYNYRIVRMYFRAATRKRVIASGLTLEQAQAHCQDPETSARTCTSSAGRARTRRMGPWFDGYEEVR